MMSSNLCGKKDNTRVKYLISKNYLGVDSLCSSAFIATSFFKKPDFSSKWNCKNKCKCMACVKQGIRCPEPPSLNGSESERAEEECGKDRGGRNEAAALALWQMSSSDVGTDPWYAGASLCQCAWVDDAYFFTIAQRLHTNSLKSDMVAGIYTTEIVEHLKQEAPPIFLNTYTFSVWTVTDTKVSVGSLVISGNPESVIRCSEGKNDLSLPYSRNSGKVNKNINCMTILQS